MRSHNRRLLPHFAHTAWKRAQQSCWGWSTKNASIISVANTTERFQIPPDLVVKFQPIDIVGVILWLVLRPRVV
jgi:hypothetical protein